MYISFVVFFQLKLEVDRLEELKMQNIKQVIEKIRVELAQFWDQCFYSQEQRQAFAPYYSGEYRGDALHVAAALPGPFQAETLTRKFLFPLVSRYSLALKYYLTYFLIHKKRTLKHRF
jgi:protein regulator of cytokinesis 1